VDMVVIGLPILGVAVMFYAYSFILSGALKGFLGGP
jgi:type VI secretion system protein ImpK